jgi:hypothetical protein
LIINTESLFGCAGKRVKTMILNFQLPLSNEGEERADGPSLVGGES